MKFEFRLNEHEQKKLAHINRGNGLTPRQFLLLVFACFVPSLIGLFFMQMWGVLLVGGTMTALAAAVPLLMTLRKSTTTMDLPRTVTLTPMALVETHANSRSFIKWNHVDDLMEFEEGFVFGRHGRFTMLPMRVIEEQAPDLQQVRDLLAKHRNVPDRPNEPVSLFQERFAEGSSSPTWNYVIQRDDLRGLFESTLMPVSESEFMYEEVLRRKKRTMNFSAIIFLVLLLMAVVLIVGSIPRGIANPGLILVLSITPFLLLIGTAVWLRRRAIRNLPLIRKEAHVLGLFPDGWAAGNENVCAFHKWCPGTGFFLSRDFVGFRIESGVVNIVPRRAIGENQQVFDFVRLAMKLKQESLLRDSDNTEFEDVPMATPLGSADRDESNNPWATPLAGMTHRKASDKPQANE